MDFIKNDFELMISIYLLTKKRISLFSQFHFNSIFKKSYLHLSYKKNLLQNFNLGTKIIFTCKKKKKEFLQFYLQKYLDSFLLKKRRRDFYKLFKMT